MTRPMGLGRAAPGRDVFPWDFARRSDPPELESKGSSVFALTASQLEDLGPQPNFRTIFHLRDHSEAFDQVQRCNNRGESSCSSGEGDICVVVNLKVQAIKDSEDKYPNVAPMPNGSQRILEEETKTSSSKEVQIKDEMRTTRLYPAESRSIYASMRHVHNSDTASPANTTTVTIWSRTRERGGDVDSGICQGLCRPDTRYPRGGPVFAHIGMAVVAMGTDFDVDFGTVFQRKSDFHLGVFGTQA
ncbi:hypothetical protein BDZ97DRAFT_2064317 [Flammula alnicola]|nr:hypothetical protein BDZ97DRAFT_2064317 [Flammula alnicola]